MVKITDNVKVEFNRANIVEILPPETTAVEPKK
jgi:hypothetical protein